MSQSGDEPGQQDQGAKQPDETPAPTPAVADATTLPADPAQLPSPAADPDTPILNAGAPSPCDTVPASGGTDGTATSDDEGDDLQKQCDQEFDRYKAERDVLIKAEPENEKNYDTTLVALSTLAIGSSFTIFKDVVRAPSTTPLIVIAWVSLCACLFVALLDKLLSYHAHRKWRLEMDAEFTEWQSRGGVGAWKRLDQWYDKIAWFKLLFPLKWICFFTLAIGVVFLLLFVLLSTAGAPPAPPAPPAAATTAPVPIQTNVTVNVYNATQPAAMPQVAVSVTTQPTKQPTTQRAQP